MRRIHCLFNRRFNNSACCMCTGITWILHECTRYGARP